MRAIIIGLVIAIVIGGLAWYLIANQNLLSPSSETSPPPTSIPQTTQIPADPQKVDELRSGGSSYVDPDGVFALLYPSDYTVDSPGDGMTRIYKQGPTQTGQTEMYDGVIIHLESINLNGQSLSDWVDEQIAQSTADGTSELTESKTATTLNSYTGYTYQLRGLGTFEYLVVQKNSTSDFAVLITTLVQDPENVGFHEEVNATLATLEILK